jgi:hypothetical protein
MEMSEDTMSNEFDGLGASEKAAMEAALNRCRVLAGRIESKLCNKGTEHFVDDLSLADFHASLERAAAVLSDRNSNTATQQHSNTATQQHSNTATQQHSNTATQQHSNKHNDADNERLAGAEPSAP